MSIGVGLILGVPMAGPIASPVTTGGYSSVRPLKKTPEEMAKTRASLEESGKMLKDMYKKQYEEAFSLTEILQGPATYDDNSNVLAPYLNMRNQPKYEAVKQMDCPGCGAPLRPTNSQCAYCLRTFGAPPEALRNMPSDPRAQMGIYQLGNTDWLSLWGTQK